MTQAPDRAVTLRQFARLLDVSPSYVTELKTAGRLVLNAEGRVLVAASQQRIRDTADPSKDGVRARHAAARAAAEGEGAEEQGAVVATAGGDSADDPIALRRSRALAEKAEAEARKALRDEQIELGQLLRRDDVVPACAAAVATLRNGLENLSATLAPELAAETDEGKVRVILADAIEHALDELSRQFAAIGKVEAA